MAGQVALFDLVQQKASVRRTVGELSAATDTECLVDGLLEPEVGLLNVAVLVGNAQVVGGWLQTVMHHQQPIALLGLRAPCIIQRMDGGTEMIGAVPLRDADDMRVIRPGSVEPMARENPECKAGARQTCRS